MIQTRREAHVRARELHRSSGAPIEEACAAALAEAAPHIDRDVARCVSEEQALAAADDHLSEVDAETVAPYILPMLEDAFAYYMHAFATDGDEVHFGRRLDGEAERVWNAWDHAAYSVCESSLPEDVGIRHQAAQLMLTEDVDVKFARAILATHQARLAAEASAERAAKLTDVLLSALITPPTGITIAAPAAA